MEKMQDDYVGLCQYKHEYKCSELKNFLIKNLIEMSPNIKNLFDNFDNLLKDSCENFNKSIEISNKDDKLKKIVKDVEEKKDFYDYQIYTKCLYKKYVTIKGHIQSGKTNFMINMSTLLLYFGFSVVIMLRNIDADREQIYNRILEFHKNQKESFLIVKKIKKEIKNIDNDKNYLFFSLSNDSNIEKINKSLEELNKPYILFIDEVDYVDSGNGIKDANFKILKDRSYCIFGISATIMDVLVKENVSSKNMIILRPPKNYKGIINNMINMTEICKKTKYSAKKDVDLIRKDTFIKDFIDEYIKKEIYFEYNHPNICLFNLTRCINPCLKIQEYISSEYPSVTTIVYNGQGISIRKGDDKNDNMNTIQEALQYLKNNGGCDYHSHILIFSGELAGRGISFVSSDYSWHLTDEVLIVSNIADEPELQQKIRLCGCYNDNIPLTLYSTKKILKDLKKSCMRQEEYLIECLSKDEFCKDVIEKYPISSNKFTKRSMVKTSNKPEINKVEKGGWDDSIYEFKQIEHEEKEISKIYKLYGFTEYRKVDYKEYVYKNKINYNNDEETVKFVEKKLSKGNTNESIFLSLLDINKEYTKEEIINLLISSNYKQPKSMFIAMTTSDNKYNSKRYGHHYFDRVNEDIDKWKIRDIIVKCWKK